MFQEENIERADACNEPVSWAGEPDRVYRAFRAAWRGFVVEAGRLRGKFASCRIKTKKEDGQLAKIVTGCATDIMLSNAQFSLRVLEPNKIARVFTDIMDMEISYHRCPI